MIKITNYQPNILQNIQQIHPSTGQGNDGFSFSVLT